MWVRSAACGRPHRQRDEQVLGRCGRGHVDAAPVAHTAQIYPIETEWREIKVAVTDILFDGLDGMLDGIRQIIGNGEIQAVKMFEWLLLE